MNTVADGWIITRWDDVRWLGRILIISAILVSSFWLNWFDVLSSYVQ
jgi:hypothetical protein